MRPLAVIALLAACGGSHPLELGVRRSAQSNVRAADYIGPEACGECHGKRYREWSSNLHRAMNRLASEPDAIVGDFSGVEIGLAGHRARFAREGGNPVMELAAPGAEPVRYRVTRTIGRRYIQEYVGVRVGGPDTEVRLPYGYWRREGRWFHQQYFDSWFDDEYDERGAPTVSPSHVDPTPWATRCAWCHNTIPFEVRIGRAHGAQPRGHGPEALVTLPGAPDAAGNRMPIESLVSVGISCEACHFGGRDHAAGATPVFAPRADALTAAAGQTPPSGRRDDPRTINLVCAQCHAAPAPLWPSGASMRNSREALDLLGSACASAAKCTDCHDPHPRGPGAGAADDPAHLAACGGCHPTIAADPRAHSHHEDTSCLDCHMPRVVQGFSSVIRSHRISAPSAAGVLSAGEPDACGLCHLEMTPRALVEALARWGQRGDAPVPAQTIEVDRPIGESWLQSDQPIVRVTAAAAYARANKRAIAPRLVAILDDPIAYYRMRVLFALEAVLGRELSTEEYEPTAPPATRRAQREALARSLR